MTYNTMASTSLCVYYRIQGVKDTLLSIVNSKMYLMNETTTHPKSGFIKYLFSVLTRKNRRCILKYPMFTF